MWQRSVGVVAFFVLSSMAAAQTTAPATQSSDLGQPQRLTYTRDLTEIPAYYIAPKAAPKGAVLLVHDIFGPSDFMRTMATDLAKDGYAVLMPDLYFRFKATEAGKQDGAIGVAGKKAADASDPIKDAGFDAKVAWLAYEATPDTQIYADLSAAISYLAETNETTKDLPLAVVGHDMGGGYAMRLAGGDLRIKAAVNYYGRVLAPQTSNNRPMSPLDSLFNLRAPLLSFYGDIDPQVPKDHVRQLESRLGNNPNKTWYRVVKYPNVGHSFLVPTRQGYNKEAAADAMTVTRQFLERTMVKEKTDTAESR